VTGACRPVPSDRFAPDVPPGGSADRMRTRLPAPTRAPATAAGAPALHRFAALDGLRGLAVLAVIVFHAFHVSEQGAAGVMDRVANRAAQSGWIGVDLFFVLSGFLITRILDATRGVPGRARTFYARRFLRIFPLYYAFLAAVFLVAPRLTDDPAPFRASLGTPAWSWLYLTNVAVALHGWGAVAEFLTHFWSLAIEEQFYLVWPWLVFWLPRERMMRVCLAVAALALACRIALVTAGQPTAAYVLMPARMDGLALGAWVALAVQDGEVRLRARSLRAAAAAALAVAVIAFARRGLVMSDGMVVTAGITSLAVLFAGTVGWAVTGGGGRAGRLLAHPALRSVGRYSYAMYVLHLPLLELYAHHDPGARAVRGVRFPYQLALAGAAVLASYGAAWISWHAWERYFLAAAPPSSSLARGPAIAEAGAP
jgi:peptidoglycan/LPS O-acetylase OafA/YrhL